MGKIYLSLQAKSTSRREPYKAIRLINGKPLFLYCLERYHHYIQTDGEFLVTTSRPADDLLAYYFMEKGLPAIRSPLRNPRDDHADILVRAACEKLGLADDDIIIKVLVDRPFCYLEDLEYRVGLLQTSAAMKVVTAPRSDIFPVHDWDWAVCSSAIHKVSYYRNPVQLILSESRLNHTASYYPAVRRGIVRSGAVPVLLVRRTCEAAALWQYQPLWVDELGQFEKARKILETLGTDPPPSSKAVRALLESRSDILLMAQGALRRSVEVGDDEAWVQTYLELEREIGSAPAMDEVG